MALAQVVIDKAVVILKDPDFVRWSLKELLGWISEAQVAIARTPGAYSVTKIMSLKEGTRQELPEDAWALVTVTRNFEDDDETPLTPIRLVTRSLMDAGLPNWHMEPRRPLVENYIYDERSPRIFYVYPPNDGTGHVEVTYQGIPAEVTSGDQPLVLDDSFVPAILSYVLFRAFSKDSDFAPGAANASTYWQAFNTDLASALQMRSLSTPNTAIATEGPVNQGGGTE